MANYKLSEVAAEDIAQIFEFGIDTFGLNAASNYIEGMTVRLQQLAEYPLQYQAVDDIREGYRRSVYRSHAIYYRIGENCIDIMRILRNQNLESSFD
ncbi:type II toxin-antitoxin system RelE/ParE family toxin [Pseudocolwellia agarivorans]|uniref:type II toxin-antitoxin system RelE/ParE family toxin n=1 Tax=Pseudocolwellia agarivorans TaxID=1911682 RepID=UPI0009878F7A|nr:type II toxin-antitoxin system RelE/ParE family toxin [Pseudocolwellia agarivorans]